MNTIQIIPTRIGYSNSILLKNNSNSILIDTGVRGRLKRFKALFKEHHLKPSDIRLIVLTHAHYDHTGNLHALVQLTGAKVLVHKNEFENLKEGFIPIPKGQGNYTKFIAETGRNIYPKFASPKSFPADLVNEDEFNLKAYGMEGKIISTPGHTIGSQSIILGKKLIAGDTFINIRNGIVFPHFANDPNTLLKTWERLFNMGIEEIYPGHGPQFKIEKALVEYEKWKKKLG